MSIKFTNNASATLAASIISSSTSITVTTGQGALFPAIGTGDYFYATLFDSSNNIEIIKVTARSGDTMTAVRGQDGTTARAWAAADKLELRVVAAALNDFVSEGGDNTLSGTNTFSGAIVSSGNNTFSGANVFSGAVTAGLTSSSTAVTATFGDSDTSIATTAFVQAALSAIYPVGSLYSSTSSTNPGTTIGFGTWVAFGAGRVLLGAGGAYAAGSTGGSADAIVVSHTHTATFTGNALPTHQHSLQARFVGAGGTTGGDLNKDYGTGATTDAVSAGTPSGSVAVTSTGSPSTDANLPPYVVVYMWQRTA